jgi:hypothetical protein
VTAATLDRWAPLFERRGLVPVAGAIASSGEGTSSPAATEPLRPGDAVAAVLVDGDLSLSALGTVTSVEGDRVLAFGHPFLGLGPVDLPLHAAEVVTVLPSVAQSVKFGRLGPTIGAVTEDRNAGIGGRLDARAEMLPVELTLSSETQGEELFHYELARHPFLVPFLTAFVCDATLSSREKSLGSSRLSIDYRAKTPAGEVSYRESFSGPQARLAAISTISLLSGFLASSPTGGTEPEAIRISIAHSDRARSARVLRVDLATREIRAGDVARLRVHLQEEKGERFVRSLELPIPADHPPGKSIVIVGGGRLTSAIGLSLVPPDPRTPADVIEVLGRLRPAVRLTALLLRPTQGAMIEGELFPDLPPTIRGLVTGGAAAPADPAVRVRPVVEVGQDLDYPVEGMARLDLVVRPASSPRPPSG